MKLDVHVEESAQGLVCHGRQSSTSGISPAAGSLLSSSAGPGTSTQTFLERIIYTELRKYYQGE